MRVGTVLIAYVAWGAASAVAQQACQPLQGTAAHATCVNEYLARQTRDTQLRALERAGQPATGTLPEGFVAPDLHLSTRDGPLPPAYAPGFSAGQAAQRLRLQQSTQSRSRALSDRINSGLRPGLGNGLGQ